MNDIEVLWVLKSKRETTTWVGQGKRQRKHYMDGTKKYYTAGSCWRDYCWRDIIVGQILDTYRTDIVDVWFPKVSQIWKIASFDEGGTIIAIFRFSEMSEQTETLHTWRYLEAWVAMVVLEERCCKRCCKTDHGFTRCIHMLHSCVAFTRWRREERCSKRTLQTWNAALFCVFCSIGRSKPAMLPRSACSAWSRARVYTNHNIIYMRQTIIVNELSINLFGTPSSASGNGSAGERAIQIIQRKQRSPTV